MIIVPGDPILWPTINAYRFSSYFSVAAFVVMIYDLALTFGKEVELVWMQHWTLMTVLYLSVRYLGILYPVLYMLGKIQTISLTNTVSFMMYVVQSWTGVLVFSMLWVIIITRLHAMYQRSRKILIFLVVTFLAVNIFDGVVVMTEMMHTSGEELVLSGTHQCSIGYTGHSNMLIPVAWIVSILWEVLTLCLAIWIAVKHFRELRRHSAAGFMGDCFTVLMKTHVLYFASFVAVCCFGLVLNSSPTLPTDQNSLKSYPFDGLLQILEVVQMFVLGPRLILSVREYNAKLKTDYDTVTDMTSMAFQERVYILTGSGV
ncbi:uncharacterized protein EDB93DRAFT_705731 [Suillus bovinus]|uniref:uncharacterized protein n=1 Tax=Suillus bovinus TaxID=48563 RepID=UPI001B85BE95|nr:uncharacterized protein EDB93DRAFT_705731 [Suillus bovinus]KAG2139205.1 hypothetical protein EDB93DRAFT_705731 [Suillus bovinus]